MTKLKPGESIKRVLTAFNWRGALPVVTVHGNGVITINKQRARGPDDASISVARLAVVARDGGTVRNEVGGTTLHATLRAVRVLGWTGPKSTRVLTVEPDAARRERSRHDAVRAIMAAFPDRGEAILADLGLL